MKRSIFCTAVGVTSDQIISQGSDIFVTVTGAALSFLVVEFLRGFIEGYKAARARKETQNNG